MTTKADKSAAALRIEAGISQLIAACKARGVEISGDGRISEDDATVLLGYAPGSLKNLRQMGMAPPYYRRAVAGKRISYMIEDLIVWIEEGREEY